MVSEKVIMTGNQGLARGFYEAGGNIAASYPGSPTVDILESVKEYPEIYSEFSVNEKVALEIAVGGSFAGGRAMVSMKHVGLNIAADPFMTFTQTKINGGFLLVTGDDPGMASSQNEQDNRILGKFANIPIFDPSSSSEAKDFVKVALDISEKYSTPSMLRITSRLCHSRSEVTLSDRIDREIKDFSGNIKDFGMIPPNTFQKQFDMKERIERLQKDAGEMEINIFEKNGNRSDYAIITSGLMYNNLKELNLDIDILKLGMIYPLPLDRIVEISKTYKNILVIEEMMPFIENELKINGINCEGKKYFSFTGEIFSEDIEEGLYNAGALDKRIFSQNLSEDEKVVERLPMFCSGCPHRPVFDILKKTRKMVVGDIGCYSLSVLPPIEVSNSIISMGASIGIAKGMAKMNGISGKKEPVIAVIGDGTFFHSGITGMIDLLHSKGEENITILILNNGLTAMTGGQENGSSGLYKESYDLKISIPDLLKSLGYDRIKVIDQFKYKEASKIINEEIKHDGLSVIMTTRPCALNYKIKEPYYYVDPSICIGCRSCVKTNCPPIIMKKYEGIEKLKSSINSDMCVGCSVCSQVCPVGAIKSSKEV